MARIDFGGTPEDIVTRKEFSLAKARKVLKNETIAVLGYGVQAPAQALNLRDNGLNVIVGARNHRQAKKDGWKKGVDLFSIEGNVPSLLSPPEGCRFAPRCPHAMDRCHREHPPIMPLSPERDVSCFLHGPFRPVPDCSSRISVTRPVIFSAKPTPSFDLNRSADHEDTTLGPHRSLARPAASTAG